MDEICEDMIVNWDPTGVNYVPVSSWTMEEEGSKKIELIGKDDKGQLTVLFAGSLNGDLLPIQIIYQGKSSRCLPNSTFLTSDISHTQPTIGPTRSPWKTTLT